MQEEEEELEKSNIFWCTEKNRNGQETQAFILQYCYVQQTLKWTVQRAKKKNLLTG